MQRKILVFSVVAIMLSCNLFAQGKAKLLYKGRYSCSSSSCDGMYGSFIGEGLGSAMVTIYDDEITILNDPWSTFPLSADYKRTTDNGTRVYNDNLGTTIYVDRNYNIYSTMTYGFNCRYNWTKGESAMPQTTYNNGGSYNSGSQKSGGSKYQEPYQKVTETCRTCKGSGREVYDTHPSVFGKDYKKYCSECGKYFWASVGHSHITCRECHGRRTVERMRRR